MRVDQTYRQHDSVSSATPGLHQDRRRGDLQSTTSDEVVAELVAVVRELHQLLGSYAPFWYTKKMQDRMSDILAAADWVPQSSANEDTRNKRKPRRVPRSSEA